MIIRLDWTEWQIREVMRALEDRAERTSPDDLELLLNLSGLHADLKRASEECLALDIKAIREEYGI